MPSTVDQYMIVSSGRPSGFDYLRIFLSIAVLLVHSVGLAEGRNFELDHVYYSPIFGPLAMAVLPMFFALSGFLVAGSLQRCLTLVSFLGLRFFRIYPALFAEVVLTALLVGPFVSSVPLQEYFTSDGFFRYLFNITGHTTTYLPNSFSTNPRPEIANVQLWTVPYELFCYIALSAIALLFSKNSKIRILVGSTLISLAMVANVVIFNDGDLPSRWGFPVHGSFLIIAFLAGVCIYYYRDIILISKSYTLLTAAIALIGFQSGFFGELIAVFACSYIVVALGVLNPGRIGIIRHADLSYGVFLYHGIVQQTLIFVWPWDIGWVLCFFTSLVISSAIAYLSWTLVEKPCLAKKNICFTLEKAVVAKSRLFRKL